MKRMPLPKFSPSSITHLAPTFLQEEAEALLELQGRLQEAQDTTEALRVQVGLGPGMRKTGMLGGGYLGQGLVSPCFLSDRGGVGGGAAGGAGSAAAGPSRGPPAAPAGDGAELQTRTAAGAWSTGR